MPATVSHTELDRGPASAGSERLCALTRQSKAADDLLRFVVSPDGEVTADVKRKLPGRGLWLTATRAALEEAAKRKVFARGFKREVRVSPDLAAQTERMLERAALDALAIAGKAGAVAAGFAKAEVAINEGDIVALVHAREAAADGIRKLDAVLKRKSGEIAREIPVIGAFSSADLDLALNRLNVIHAAVLTGPVSATFLARSGRLLRFRSGPAADADAIHGAGDGAAHIREELRTE